VENDEGYQEKELNPITNKEPVKTQSNSYTVFYSYTEIQGYADLNK